MLYLKHKDTTSAKNRKTQDRNIVNLTHASDFSIFKVSMGGFNPPFFGCFCRKLRAHVGQWYGVSGLAKVLWQMGSPN
jgi:hypothetical protein